MRLVIVFCAVLAAGCTDIASAQPASLEECSPSGSSTLEGQIIDALETASPSGVIVRLERDDGRVLETWHGTPNQRWITSSMAKPIMVAVLLDQVARGRMTLRSRAIDIVPTLSSQGRQLDIELRHLLAFTSGIVSGPVCYDQPTWAAYTGCVDTLPSLNDPQREPGVAWAYSTRMLDIAAVMAVAAAGVADWAALFEEWRAATGLFAGATWSASFRFTASREINVTASEYVAFLRAIEDCSFLTMPNARLCAAMQSDQLPIAMVVNGSTGPLAGPDGQPWGEDWRFGFGLWLECRTPAWSCPRSRRVSSIGVAGQYAVTDREHGYRAVVSPSFGTNATFRGVSILREIEPLLERWAALGALP